MFCVSINAFAALVDALNVPLAIYIISTYFVDPLHQFRRTTVTDQKTAGTKCLSQKRSSRGQA